MEYRQKQPTILMVDDDEDDFVMVRDAFDESGLSAELLLLRDGIELMEFLSDHDGSSADSSRPDLILLDLNMPRKDGRTALRELKTTPRLRGIPVVILTTSKEAEDILYCYDLGASVFITKPSTFTELVAAIRIIWEYWFKVAQLPGRYIHPHRGALAR